MTSPCGLRGFEPTLRVLVFLGLLHQPATAETTIKVTSGIPRPAHLPVTVVLPRAMTLRGSEKLELLDSETQAVVPVQTDDQSGKQAITWIAGNIPAGQTSEYRLRSASTQSDPNKIGVECRKTGQGLDVLIDGELVTSYRIDAGPKPILMADRRTDRQTGDAKWSQRPYPPSVALVHSRQGQRSRLLERVSQRRHDRPSRVRPNHQRSGVW